MGEGAGPLIGEALREAAASLDPVSDTARLDAELLMAHALGVGRADLLLRHMRDRAPAGFADLVERRLLHEPVAYIAGHQEFYGRSFRVSPDVLIPRADSETTVGAALDACPQPGRMLDCGTGSGALLLTVLAERQGATGIGMDRSAAALAIARENALSLCCADRAEWAERNWHSPGWQDGLGTFDLILANPPYVEADAPLDPGVRDWEPAGALFAGAEGLDDYRILVPQLPALLADGGVAVLEIGAVQADAVAALAGAAGFRAQLRHDLAGRPRAMILRLPLGKQVRSVYL